MDPLSIAPEASSLAFLFANIATAIQTVTGKHKAATSTPTIEAQCSAISAALKDIQSLLRHPSALSSQILSQIQLRDNLIKVYNGCTISISRLEEELEKITGNPTVQGARDWRSTQLCDEILVKALLQQIHGQLTDACLLIVAAQRNSSSENRQMLNYETSPSSPVIAMSQMDYPTSSKPGGYTQSIWEHIDSDSKSVCTRASDNVSRVSFNPGPSELYSSIDYEAPSVPPLSEKTKKVPRAHMGSIFFKLFKSNTELHRAARKGDTRKIKSLIDLGVDINYEGSSGCTALHIATDSGQDAVVRLLLSNGADPAAKSSEGRTPLHSAARIGNPAVVRLLLDKVIDVHARDPSGSTALHIAAFNGHESVVQILLEKHPWREVRGGSGFTALHVAAFNGQSAVVRLLVEMGADLEARSDTGRSALQLAAERGHEAVVRYLLQHGANVLVKDSLGRTALQGAVSNQHGVVAQLLLDKAVSPANPSRRPSLQDPKARPAYELSAGEVFSKQHVSMAPTYELSHSSVAIELPANDMNSRFLYKH